MMTTDDPAPVDRAADAGPDLHQPAIHASLERYWVRNVRIMATLTLAWLVVGLGCGVLFADRLNEVNLYGTGYPLGFWFAQQGSIIGFVLIILVYCTLMNWLDAKHHAELDHLRTEQRGES
jgi:putative solute:sodium symporter small subunit